MPFSKPFYYERLRESNLAPFLLLEPVDVKLNIIMNEIFFSPEVGRNS